MADTPMNRLPMKCGQQKMTDRFYQSNKRRIHPGENQQKRWFATKNRQVPYRQGSGDLL